MKPFYLFVLLGFQLGMSSCNNTLEASPSQTQNKPSHAENAISSQSAELSTRPFENNAHIAGKNAKAILHNEQVYWLLTSETQGVLLTDENGKVLSRIEGNMEVLDWRDNIHIDNQSKGLVVTLDNDKSTVMVLALDWASFSLSTLTEFSSGQAQAEAVCWYQMPQGHLSLFIADALGMVQQRLLVDTKTQTLVNMPIRQFIGTPENKGCAVDDQNQNLYLVEANIGLWQYPADPESEFQRELVFAAKPNGPLDGELTHVSVLPNQALILSAPEQQGIWQVDPTGQHSPKFYALLGLTAPESANAVLKNNQVILGLFDDENASYHQATLASHKASADKAEAKDQISPVVTFAPIAQTTPVARFGDAADDPAIWVNSQDPSQSLILGTDKKQGLMVYDLAGDLVQSLNVGRVNNVDVRYGFKLGDQKIDIAVASNRTHNSISVFSIASDSGKLTLLNDIPTTIDDVYGICMAHIGNQYQVFINGTDGLFQQYQLIETANNIQAKLIATRQVASQPEGCVVDDTTGDVYYGEEALGVWKTHVNKFAAESHLIAQVKAGFEADIEGMGIYVLDKQRYLVVSSQGINNYAVFALDDNNRYLGSFDIGVNIQQGIDGVSETDGLEVLSTSLGEKFPMGIMVAQDGRNVMPSQPQNFKIVDGQLIANQIRAWIKQQ